MQESTNLGYPAACTEDQSTIMIEEEVLACSFDSWYRRFKDITLKSCVLSLPEDFVEYLLNDGISMPSGVNFNAGGDDSDSEWGDGGSDSEDGSQERNGCPHAPSFPELQREIEEAISSLGGSVFPKLNWSAPKDARWMLGSLKCLNASDVFTLLKASDFVAHDLCHCFDHCAGSRKRPERFSLVLRRWYDLDQAGEFRCFVHDGQLIALSQRHTSVHFPHLTEAAFMEGVQAQIIACFEGSIQKEFPLQRYVFDVFVGKPPRQKVSLVDFSPWGASTDPLLFAWEELQEIASQESAQLPVIKTVKNESDVRTKLENYHALPLEVAQLGACTSDEVEELCRRAQAGINAQQQ